MCVFYLFCVFCFFFFFSSRRRHTRSLRDWSSDVCSSDLRRLRLDAARAPAEDAEAVDHRRVRVGAQDRKSTRLNSSHVEISYAVFCLKKKKIRIITTQPTSQFTACINSPAHRLCLTSGPT